ncbi:MAG: GNAT family N-acetyltransferase [Akkermansiaceae bacterium]|nr:GNAT family N-acetyltransferase [Akkermansiaceae bacterium]
MNSLVIRLVEPSDLPDALRLLAGLNPEVDEDELKRRMKTIRENHGHYELHGAFEGGNLVAVCGAWVATKLWCGRYLEIDNIVTDPERRSEGLGTRLMEAMEELARKRNCEILVLDSYASNTSSHRLYHRLGYEIKGFHFVKALGAVLNPPTHA